MNKTVTVKGSGKASARPDTVVISMELESRNREYDAAMNAASTNIAELTGSLVSAGFAKEDIKTVNFNVNTEHKSVQDRNGNYRREFSGYLVAHDLRLEFGLDTARLSKALSAIGGCGAHPSISTAFTVKDPTALNSELLRSAAESARSRAEVLCAASGMKLGQLVTIDYSWGELNVYSNTRYAMAEECLALGSAADIDIEPEDISVSDTVTFVWEMT